MKKIIIFAMLILFPLLACAQTVATDPITIEWDGSAEHHEVGIQSGTNNIVSLGTTTVNEYYIDLQSAGYYGVYIILVRGYETLAGVNYYTDWIRSDNPEDVIMVDGVAQTIVYISIERPTMLRIR